jgi:hypothetical protein
MIPMTNTRRETKLNLQADMGNGMAYPIWGKTGIELKAGDQDTSPFLRV